MEIIKRYKAVQAIRHTNELGSRVERRVLTESEQKINPDDESAIDGALMCEAPNSDEIETSEILRPHPMVALRRELGFRAFGFDLILSRKTYARVFAGNRDKPTEQLS